MKIVYISGRFTNRGQPTIIETLMGAVITFQPYYIPGNVLVDNYIIRSIPVSAASEETVFGVLSDEPVKITLSNIDSEYWVKLTVEYG